jgi:hypothetical protein
MTPWRQAWRSMRAAAGLPRARFHNGRHTAITTLAEKGLTDWVIQAQVGHVSPMMMKTYSHIRRQALNEAAAALEPTSADAGHSNPPDSGPEDTVNATRNPTDASAVDSAKFGSRRTRKSSRHSSPSQNDVSTENAIGFVRKIGSPHWTISATGSSVRQLDMAFAKHPTKHPFSLVAQRLERIEVRGAARR